MLLQDLLHTFLGLPIFPPKWLKSYTGSWLPLILNSRSSSLSPNLLALPPAISLTLPANQCLQHLTALMRSADHLDLFVLVSGLPCKCRAFAVTGPCAWNGLPTLVQAKLMSGISATSCRSLKSFFSPRASALSLPSQYCERRSINVL